jgi:hemoglobin/transferrin/lactoferrin receptor protein
MVNMPQSQHAPRARLALVTAALLAGAAAAHASEEQPLALEPVVVVASKTPQPLSSIAGQVSVIDASEMRRNLVEDLDQLLRYEPGVDVSMDGTRFGADGISIRGIGGNRVAIEIDGVPLRQGFAIGSYASAGRTLVETDRIKLVEILHGPASTLYGSDALGGVLAFSTWDPDDLPAPGRGHYLAARAGYQSANDGWAGSGQAAWAGQAHGLLFSGTTRRGHETASAAASAAQRDRQNIDSQDLAARYTFDTGAGNRWRLSANHYERDTLTDVTSLLGFERFADTMVLRGDDSDLQQQLVADFDFATGQVDQGTIRAFYSETETRQNTLEERATANQQTRFLRSFELDDRLAGLELNLFRSYRFGNSRHRLGAGFEFLDSRTEPLRDGLQQDLASGTSSTTVLGEALPTRDFPISTVRETGIFIEDNISLADGRWELSPALRYDWYDLSPSLDALYLQRFPDSAVVSITDSRLTPRFSALYRPGPGWSVYAQYAEGFRAPPAEDANIGFDLPLLRFRAIPNPDLVSETSRGYELGLRHFGADQRFSLTWFDTRFDDFIESRAALGFDPVSRYVLFQSRNIDEARIYGLDIRLEQALGAWLDGLQGWKLRLAGYWSRGNNEQTDQPLNSVAPPQAVVGVDWDSADGRLDARLTATLTGRQQRIDESAFERFQPGSSEVVDISAGWQLHPQVSLRAAVFNLTDQTYWRWADIANLAANDPMIPLLAQPGRNYALSLNFAW